MSGDYCGLVVVLSDGKDRIMGQFREQVDVVGGGSLSFFRNGLSQKLVIFSLRSSLTAFLKSYNKTLISNC